MDLESYIHKKGTKKQNNTTNSKKHVTRTNRIQKNHHQKREVKIVQRDGERFRLMKLEILC